MSRLTRVLDERALPLAELQAARLDGEVFAFERGWCAIDVEPGPADRLAAATVGRPARLIAERLTAAWVWGALDAPPVPARFCIDSTSRAAPGIAAEVAVREVVLAVGETVAFGAARVTSPLRTVQDLARGEDWGAQTGEVVLRLVEASALRLDDAIAALAARPRLTRKHLAIARLRGLTRGLSPN